MSDSEAPAVTAETVLDPPSPEEAPTAEAQVEEEEVAYDEEPDEEQQADGHALPSSEDAPNEVLQQVALHRLVIQPGSQAEVHNKCLERCAFAECPSRSGCHRNCCSSCETGSQG